jgi:hypothetical protein
MPAMAERIAAEDAEVEAIRQKFGDEKAAELAVEFAKRRRAPATGYLAGFPKWVVILVALWVASLETADKLPQLMLTYPRYEAALAEAKAKLLQPDLMTAQLATAQFQALAAAYQPATAEATQKKLANEAAASVYLPEQNGAVLEKTRSEVLTAAIQPDLSKSNLEKLKFEIQYAALQPAFTALQMNKLGVDTQTSKFQISSAASDAIQKEQATATQAAMIHLLTPLVSKYLGVSPEILGPAWNMINTNNRLPDRNAAMSPSRIGPTPQAAAALPVQASRPAPAPAPIVSCLINGVEKSMTRDQCRAASGSIL